ncbi:unnamed protein product [Alopecurus aequalis]
MDREGHAAAAAIPCNRWAEDVIVLSSGRPTAADHPDPPLDKLYYKTKLCDKFETGGYCMYEAGCTFAHGRADLRPPLPASAAGFGGGVWRRGDQQDHPRGGGYGYGYGGRVCHNFRDKGSCHFGDKCLFPHAASPAPPPGRGPGEQKQLVAEARRPTTAPRYAGGPGPGRAYPPVPAASSARDRLRPIPEEDGAGGGRKGKASVLELLSLRKTNGIYGDWPEQYQN